MSKKFVVLSLLVLSVFMYGCNSQNAEIDNQCTDDCIEEVNVENEIVNEENNTENLDNEAENDEIPTAEISDGDSVVFEGDRDGGTIEESNVFEQEI